MRQIFPAAGDREAQLPPWSYGVIKVVNCRHYGYNAVVGETTLAFSTYSCSIDYIASRHRFRSTA